MNRRNAVKKIAIASGSLISLPFWMTACSSDDKSTTHLSSFSVAEQETLAAIVDTIIPAGNSIGALAVGVDKFLQKLLDDCYEKEVQDNIKAQLKGLEQMAQTLHQRSFKQCDKPYREALFIEFSLSPGKPQKDFFTLLKSETIRGFNTSQQVMEKYLDYKIAPGYYHGNVNIKA